MVLLAVVFGLVLNHYGIEGSLDDITARLYCEADRMTVEWTIARTKLYVSSQQMSASLSNGTCSSDDNKDGTPSRSFLTMTDKHVTLNITSSYGECGTSIVDGSYDEIHIKNTALLRVTDILGDGNANRLDIYTYYLTCGVTRRVLVSYSSLSVTVTNFTMDFYTDRTFANTYPAEINVRLTDNIFVKIKERHNLKFVIEQCFASPNQTFDASNIDIVFNKRCKWDITFEIIETVDNSFAFKIETNYYIADHSAVYLHCRVHICTDSSDANCVQQCDPTAIDSGQLNEMIVTTNKIVFKRAKTCEEVVCPPNSLCLSLIPSQCVCDEGFVFDGNACSQERLAKVEDFKVNEEWSPVLADASSEEFRQLANTYERMLYKSFQANNVENIEAIRIINMRPGSIIFDILIIYVNTSTPKEAFDSFIRSVTSNNTISRNMRKVLKVADDFTRTSVTFIPEVKVTITKNTPEKKTIAISIVLVLSVIFPATIKMLTIIRGRTTGSRDITNLKPDR